MKIGWVVDISNSDTTYKIGNFVPFELQYMGGLYLLNSDYIEKNIG